MIEFSAKMLRVGAKRFNTNMNPVGKSQRCISRRLSLLRTRIGVIFLFAFGAALIFISSSPARSAQQPAGAGSQPKPGPAMTSEASMSQSSPQTQPGPKLSDFAWLEGRWRGDWGPRVAEQVWMAPKAGMMLGDFRLIENDKVLVVEFFTLVERPGNINFYFRHFTPELVPWEKSDATLLKLAAADPKKSEFENPANGKPKRVVFSRIDADTYTWRSEIIPENGDPQIVEITYHRQPLAAIAPNSGSGAHTKKK
jgi:hypothetical protein